MAPCQLCNNQEKRDDVDARLAFDFTPEELIHTAFEQRCSSCLVILEGFRQSETTDWKFQNDVRRVYARCCGMRNNHSDSLQLEVYFTDDRPKLELEFYSLQPHAWKAILPRPTISGHPMSSQALQWVRSLIKTCSAAHGSCKNTEQSFLPKRVLAIRNFGVSSITIRLLETNQEHAVYAALSHCWGSEQSCVTTSSTLEDRKRGIPWHSVPKTFQDAIMFVLKLGIQYIWIDSLCIIQDDATDWEIESSKMADVYQYAAITISATSSTGDSQGCFPVTSKPTTDLEINLPEDVGACRIAVRKPLEHWNSLIPSQLQQRFPLLSRGWAYQERILAPTVLHFCESELVWECREAVLCECGGLGEDSSPGGKYYKVVQDAEEENRKITIAAQEQLDQLMAAQLQEELEWEVLQAHHKDAGMSSTAAPYLDDNLPPPYIDALESPDNDLMIIPRTSSLPIYETTVHEEETKQCSDMVLQFHRIVEQYSALRLTKPTDRLPALSGLCRRIQHLRGDYLAGLWSDSLCYDLLWRVNTLDLSATNAGRSPRYRGPSWSWITAQSPVSYWSDIVNFEGSTTYIPPRSELDPVRTASFTNEEWQEHWDPVHAIPLGRNSENVHAVVDVSGHNPLGEVKSAILSGEASATAATLIYTYDSYWHDHTNKHDPARYKLSVSTLHKNRGHTTARDSRIEIPFFADYALGLDGPHRIDEGAQLKLLLVHPKIALVLTPKLKEGVVLAIYGEPAWERIGIARISEALGSYYRVDWMRAAKGQRFKIV